MGLGKTLQTISLLAHLIESKNDKGPFLVLVPLSTLTNWANEFARWAPAIRVVQLKGSQYERKEIVKRFVARGDFNVLLTTYEFAMRDKQRLGSTHWRYIIVDEGHRLKNANSKFAKILSQDYKSRYRLLITGTPLQNSLPELWSLLNFILPQIFNSVEDFEAWFSEPFAAYQDKTGGAVAGAEAAALSTDEKLVIINRLHDILRPFLLRRMKQQVLTQLPEKVESVIYCELSAWQRLQYRQVQKYDTVALEPDHTTKTSRGLNNKLVQLRKVCNHPFLFRNSYDRSDELMWRSSGKVELLDRILPKLKACGHRVLIFFQMVEMLKIFADYVEDAGHEYLTLDGTTSSDDRETRMREWNAPDSPYFIFLLSTRAGGLGINLATADTVVIFDSDWNPTMDAQAAARAHRIGQLREVRVFRLITLTPVEKHVLSRAMNKASMEAVVIGKGNFGGGEEGADAPEGADKRTIEELLNEDLDAHKGSSGGADEEGGDAVERETEVPDDEALNEIIARGEEEFKVFQRMDRERLVRERAEGKIWALGAGTRSGGGGDGGGGAGSSSSSSSSSSDVVGGVGVEEPTDQSRLDALAREIAAWTRARLLSEKLVPGWAHFSARDLKQFDAALLAKAGMGGKKNRTSNYLKSGVRGADDEDEDEDDDDDGAGVKRERKSIAGVISDADDNAGSLVNGRRMRHRREDVSYGDGLTELQWQRMVDDGKDPAEEQRKRRAAVALAAAPAPAKAAPSRMEEHPFEN